MDSLTQKLRLLEERIGYFFKASSLLEGALTHPSFLKTKEASFFERAEFLGDRVMGLVICDYLFKNFLQEKEGVMARQFAQLVRKETLAAIARSIDLGAYLILSKGEKKAGAQNNESILADSLEALIAAVYLDGGWEPAQKVVLSLWAERLESVNGSDCNDAKSALQEWAQQRAKPLPVYEVLQATGPDHAPTFYVEVSLEGWSPLVGEGPSKKMAEQSAAHKMLDKIGERT